MSCKATSRLKRASLTCELAGFGAAAEVDRDLLEWNYGNYDGRTSVDIHAERPDWLLFRDGYPGGENARRGRGAGRSRGLPCPGRTRDVLVFSSGISLPCATHF